jgi:hypothetical protein
VSEGEDEPAPRPPLPRRPPRALGIHWLVDSAVAFCVIVIPALFFGAPLAGIAVAALVVGAALAPFSRRREVAALARRPEPPLPPSG